MSFLVFHRIATVGLLASAVTLAMGLTWDKSQAADTWKLYTPNPTQNTPAKDLQKAADEIEKETNGELKVRVLLGGTLQIQTPDISNAVSLNVIQIGDDQLYGGVVPIGGVTRLPALLRSTSEYEKAAAIIDPYVRAAYAKLNVSVLATFNFPKVIFYSRSKLTSLKDLKDLKIRTYSPEGSEAVKRFGAIPVTMALPEIAPALERGIIDGLIASAPASFVYKDLIKYIYVLPVIVAANDFVIINNEALANLSTKNQEIVRRVFKETMSGTSRRMEDEERGLNQKMVESGIVQTEATPEERMEFERQLSSYWDIWAKERGPDAVEVLQKIRAAINR